MPRGRRKGSQNVKSALFKSAEWIGWTLGGIEREIGETRERLTMLTEEAAKLRARVGGAARGAVAAVTASDAPGRRRRRGRMSTEARKRISELMKKRWAEAKKKNRNRL